MTERIEDTNKFMENIRKAAANKDCFDCGDRGTTYFVTPYGIFVCAKCAGFHREINSKVKAFGVSNFTEKECMLAFQNGNEKAKKIWMATFNPAKHKLPISKNPAEMKIFITSKYIERKYCEENVEKYEKRVDKAVSKKLGDGGISDDVVYSSNIMNTDGNVPTSIKIQKDFDSELTYQEREVNRLNAQLAANKKLGIYNIPQSKKINEEFKGFEFEDNGFTNKPIEPPRQMNSSGNLGKSKNIVFPQENGTNANVMFNNVAFTFEDEDNRPHTISKALSSNFDKKDQNFMNFQNSNNSANGQNSFGNNPTNTSLTFDPFNVNTSNGLQSQKQSSFPQQFQQYNIQHGQIPLHNQSYNISLQGAAGSNGILLNKQPSGNVLNNGFRGDVINGQVNYQQGTNMNGESGFNINLNSLNQSQSNTGGGYSNNPSTASFPHSSLVQTLPSNSNQAFSQNTSNSGQQQQPDNDRFYRMMNDGFTEKLLTENKNNFGVNQMYGNSYGGYNNTIPLNTNSQQSIYQAQQGNRVPITMLTGNLNMGNYQNSAGTQKISLEYASSTNNFDHQLKKLDLNNEKIQHDVMFHDLLNYSSSKSQTNNVSLNQSTSIQTQFQGGVPKQPQQVLQLQGQHQSNYNTVSYNQGLSNTTQFENNLNLNGNHQQYQRGYTNPTSFNPFNN